MKAICYGLQKENKIQIEKVPCEEINIQSLINTFESNLDKQPSPDWFESYLAVSKIYKSLYTEGELPDIDIREEHLEQAYECLDDDIDHIMEGPKRSDGMNFHYEFIRSFAVENQAAQLKEYIDEECDFI